ncbi:sialidase family protein [Stenotrophomonas sp. 24(2023)]|uniref:sialidase family protein n=1 Tax=Stenotrophomonas sp. 24(2023) TaxID=3068324 RepID=UPI0027E1D7DD|nr:sialidase family protein [Stenotrophomonas sp. 24(2023)]WMJ68227.1 sialidase family protein [Stenotrophomonas sp. 24(2023)]
MALIAAPALARGLRAVLIAGLLAAALPVAAVDVQWHGTATVDAENAGWGRMARLADGHWLAVTTRFHAGQPTTLQVSASTDNARSWQPLSSVAEPGRMIDNGELFVLPDGRILLAMRSLIEGSSYRLHLYASDDQARSWTFLSTIARNEAPAGRKDRGVWEPVLTQLDGGVLSVVYADETRADEQPSYNQVVSQRLSTDGGRTWGPVATIARQPGGGLLRPGMPVMARRPQGGFLMVLETCGDDPQCPVSYKVSPDGRNWPDGLGTPLADQRCGPHVMATRSGTMFVTSCANAVSWSSDSGAHWQRVPDPAWPLGFRHSWPAVVELGPGEIGVINSVDGAVKIRFGTYH